MESLINGVVNAIYIRIFQASVEILMIQILRLSPCVVPAKRLVSFEIMKCTIYIYIYIICNISCYIEYYNISYQLKKMFANAQVVGQVPRMVMIVQIHKTDAQIAITTLLTGARWQIQGVLQMRGKDGVTVVTNIITFLLLRSSLTLRLK